MKKYLIRIIVLFVLIISYFLLNTHFSNIQKKYNQKKLITFELPLPEEISSRFGINETNPIEIDKVIVAGFFSDWDPNDDFFRMKQISQKKWQIVLPLEPGQTQYKFVIHTKVPYFDNQVGDYTKVIWVHDKNAKIQIQDGFGGYNSVIEIKSIIPTQLFFRYLFFSIILYIFLYSILEILIKISFKFHLKLKLKVIFVLIFIIFSFSIIYLYNGYKQNIELIKIGISESLNLIHNYLNIQNISIEKKQENLNILFKNIKARIYKKLYSNFQLSISSLLIFDKDFNIIAMKNESGAESILNNEAKLYGYKDINDYFRNGIFSNFIEKNKKKNIDTLFLDSTPDNLLKFRKKSDLKLRKYFNKDLFIYPIKDKFQIIGYYGGRLNCELYGYELRNFLIENLWILFFSLLIYIGILLKIGDFIILNIKNLTKWLSNINKGIIDENYKLDTHDEFEELFNTSKKIALSLKHNLDNLRLINLMTNKMKNIENIDDLFGIFLVFISANFVFKFNRVAIFLKEDDKISGKYSVGCLDFDELNKTFGSYENYKKLEIDIQKVIEDYKKYVEMIPNEFNKAVKEIQVFKNENSILWDVVKNNKSYILRKNDNLPYNEDYVIKRKLNLEEFALLPVYKGNETIGVILVDNYFDKTPINEEIIEQVKLIINDFSLILENIYSSENKKTSIGENIVKEDTNIKILNEYELITKQIQNTKSIYEDVLNKNFLAIKDIHCYYKNLPIDNFSGDFFDICEIHDKYYRIIFGDTKSNGLKGLILSFIMRTEYEKIKQLNSCNEILNNLNNILYYKYKNYTEFISILIIDIDLKNNILFYSNAGANYPFIFNKNFVKQLKTKGKMLGLNEDIKYLKDTIKIDNDLRILLFSDGIYKLSENINEQDIDEFINNILMENKDREWNFIFKNLLEKYNLYFKSFKQNDDITLLGIDLF